MPNVTESKPNQVVRTEYRARKLLSGVDEESVVRNSQNWVDSITKDKGSKRDWRNRIRNGLCATTPLNATTMSHTLEGGSAYGRSTDLIPPVSFDSQYWLSGHMLGTPGSPAIPSHLTSQATNQSLIRFYRELAAVESKFKGLVFGGELKQTLNMVKSPFKALRGSLSHYLTSVEKRGKKRALKDRTRVVRETWLEYSYGLRPLLSDIDSAIDSFYASKAIKPHFQMVRGRSSVSEFEHIWDDVERVTWGVIRVGKSGGDRYSAEVTHYGIYASSGNGRPNEHSYGFSPWEFVPTLWELIPYSFLVDYFTNVGGVLESWSYRFLGPRFTSQTIVRSGVREIVGNIRATSLSTSSNKVFAYGSGGSHTVSRKSIVREDDVGTILPSLTLKVPGNWSTWTNLAALGDQARATSSRLRRP